MWKNYYKGEKEIDNGWKEKQMVNERKRIRRRREKIEGEKMV